MSSGKPQCVVQSILRQCHSHAICARCSNPPHDTKGTATSSAWHGFVCGLHKALADRKGQSNSCWPYHSSTCSAQKFVPPEFGPGNRSSVHDAGSTAPTAYLTRSPGAVRRVLPLAGSEAASQDRLLFVPLVVWLASVAEQRRRVAVARAIRQATKHHRAIPALPQYRSNRHHARCGGRGGGCQGGGARRTL